MAAMAETFDISKSAKRRAAKKVRDAAAVEEAAPPAPVVPEPKAKAKAKAKAPPPALPDPVVTPEPKAKAKAKAEPKAVAAPVAPVAPEPKAKAKAKAKTEAAPVEAKSKVAPKDQSKVEEPIKKVEELIPVELDDGSGDAWAVADGLNLKKRRQKERAEDQKKLQDLLAAQGNTGNKYVPGMAPVSALVAEANKKIPGMAQSAGQPAVSQAVSAVPGAAPVAATEGAAPKIEAHTATVNVPDNRVGIVIGPKGAKIKLIQEKTETRIDTSGEAFTITGSAKGVAMAEAAVKELVTKGYTSLAFEDFSENFVMVPKESFPDLIGKKGAVVIEMKDKLHVEVTFPETAKVPVGKKCKVTIAGAVKNVEKCKEVINSILMYGHHEITHPDQDHEEIEVPDWAYSAIIGKKGCELRHIQNSYRVRVNIPREGSLCQNVVVVGEKEMVPKAKAYIEKCVWNFTNQSRGREKNEGSTDDWGDEGPIEDWMRAYLYKR